LSLAALSATIQFVFPTRKIHGLAGAAVSLIPDSTDSCNELILDGICHSPQLLKSLCVTQGLPAGEYR
jgi:hypothetical protein